MPGCRPAAHCYCGFQFGYFSGQLGDGATMYLGEVVTPLGDRWEVQYKGAGLTPFSRTADGRKVLRSSVREFLASEAMHFLGVPTTRAGAVVTSEDTVARDPLHHGEVVQERCSVVLRIARTFLRFGSFEIARGRDDKTGRAGPSAGDYELLRQLTRFTIKHYFPHVQEAHAGEEEEEARMVAWLREVVRLTAELVAHWQAIGFCHGVLNTDNMSIIGLTLDYGPYGFMDTYDPHHICNGSDEEGRYAFDKQPSICKWNLQRLAESLQPLLPADASAPAIDSYDDLYAAAYLQRMRNKLGLCRCCDGEEAKAADSRLIADLLTVMEKTQADFTNSFRAIMAVRLPWVEHEDVKEEEAAAAMRGSEGKEAGEDEDEVDDAAVTADIATALADCLSHCRDLAARLRALAPSVDEKRLDAILVQMQMMPSLRLRMGRALPLIEREVEKRVARLALKDDSDEALRSRNEALWTAWLTRYWLRLKQQAKEAFRAGLSKREACVERRSLAARSNPLFVLRNHIAQKAIAAAESGDDSEVRRVLARLQHPYEEDVKAVDSHEEDCRVPLWGEGLCVTCSS
eukprot:PLAT12749.3.p1 GENE.PLAT12749.3~~PLAT12749.3.p1  ORF type:complete len:663 (+),score=294.92 PLAT12749.3:272-1990(+)